MWSLSGAHDLILHILEPSLQQRATLHDIALHSWLQDGPQQDSTGPCENQQPEVTVNDSLSDGYIRLRGRSSSENLERRLSEYDNNRTRSCLDRRRSMSPAVFAPSCYDSLLVQETDGHLLPVSSCRSPDKVLVDDEGSGHSELDEVITGNCVLMCDNSVDCHCRRLSHGVSSREHSDTGGSFGDTLTSTPHPQSYLCFQSVTHNHHVANSNHLSDAGHAITSDIPSKGVLAATNETARLAINFSADSLELFADEVDQTNSIDDSESRRLSGNDCDDAGVKDLVDADDSDEDEAVSGHLVRYDFADIDAVLDHIASSVDSTVADVDAGSQVSYDSLEDAAV